MKADRLFYTGAAALFLVVIVAGFRHYIFGGKHDDLTPIDPSMLLTVVAHSTAIFAWFVLFFVQSLLIASKNRKVHMKLGWSVLVIGTAIALTGPLVAYRSMRFFPTQVIFEWSSRQFLLVMWAEIALFGVFAAVGVLYRKQPRVHRPMMLMASLAILSGATARIPLVASIFGDDHWKGLFGPVVALGAFLLVVRWALTRRLDREFAVGFAAFTVVMLMVGRLAFTNVWVNWAEMILKM